MVREDRKLNEGVEILHCREEDGERLNDLFNLVFNKQRELKGWVWKFKDNPAFEQILGSVAVTEDGRVAGMYPLLIAEYKVRNKLALGVQSVEIAIHPDFRGRWVVARLKDKSWEKSNSNGMKFGFGFPTRDHAKVGIRYMKYKLLGDLPIMGLRINWGWRIKSRMVQRVFGRFLYLSGIIYYYLRFSRVAQDVHDGAEITESPGFDGEYDRLWESISREYQVIGHRSSRYLNWRYLENPLADFTILEAKRKGELIGYIAYTTCIEEGQKNGIIFDFICRSDEPAGRSLLKTCLLKLLRERVKAIRCGALPHTHVYGYLEALGFKELPSSPPVCLELFDKEDEDEAVMSDLDNWYLSIGDTDLLGW